MRNACSAKAIPLDVNLTPERRLKNNFEPKRCSSLSTRRPTVVWTMPKSRAASVKLPARATARKMRRSSQSSRRPMSGIPSLNGILTDGFFNSYQSNGNKTGHFITRILGPEAQRSKKYSVETRDLGHTRRDDAA